MAKTEANILIVDDDLDVLVSAQVFLKQMFSRVHVEQRPERVLPSMKQTDFDIILLDMNFHKGKNDGCEGISLLEQIQKIDPLVSVILITAYGGVDLAVSAMKSGAFDFIEKPWKNDKLLGVVQAALQLRHSRNYGELMRKGRQALIDESKRINANIIGRSEKMLALLADIHKIAPTDANVLILGENGSGKEVFAREIHQQSHRSEGVFVKVDLGALPDSLFESELFGHEKGAFTDAKEAKEGRLEQARGGTLFLDEIGNLPLALQQKLLHVLENRTFCRLGSNKNIPLDFRLICATNSPLSEMLRNESFRKDLYYRIRTLEISIPPLRERIEDISDLLHYYLGGFSRKYGKKKLLLPQSVIRSLKKYSWPGNVRELKHLVERAVILASGDRLHLSDFQINDNTASVGNADDELKLSEMEKRYILKAISKNNGNITQAARDLGIARTALYRRLEKYGL